MINKSLIFAGKTISQVSKSLNRGNGSTWPGHIALKGNKNFIKEILSKSSTKIIIVAGTNGKTTTSALIKTGLEKNGKTVLQNASGANLLNGIASALLLHTNASGKLTQDYAIFEIDENVLPLALDQITPDYLILLNLFRDQLDRYGEINTIVKKWQNAIGKLSEKTTLILNADDPQIAAIPVFLTIAKQRVYYFGLQSEKTTEEYSHEAADSMYCPKCGSKLIFETRTFSHLGKWKCNSCGLHRPELTLQHLDTYPLIGTYNKYNSLAATLVLTKSGLTNTQIVTAFQHFKPAFGRQEIISYRGKNVQLFLSKNPTSFNQSFATIKELKAKVILFVLNDRIPDGHDISWIWDTDLSGLENLKQIIISGDRTYDMSIRVKYEQQQKWERENSRWKIEPDLVKAINFAIQQTEKDETLYILPNYSAMLEVRKILIGKKIL